jgi:hypothetical protein
MGSTFVDIDEEHGFWIHDGILELWLLFLALHVDCGSDAPELRKEMREKWLVARLGFNGCVPHGLEWAVSTAEGKKIVLETIESLMKALKKAPETLNKDVINLFERSGAYWLEDCETWRLIEVGEAFKDLIEGKIMSTSADRLPRPGGGDHRIPLKESPTYEAKKNVAQKKVNPSSLCRFLSRFFKK